MWTFFLIYNITLCNAVIITLCNAIIFCNYSYPYIVFDVTTTTIVSNIPTLSSAPPLSPLIHYHCLQHHHHHYFSHTTYIIIAIVAAAATSWNGHLNHDPLVSPNYMALEGADNDNAHDKIYGLHWEKSKT